MADAHTAYEFEGEVVDTSTNSTTVYTGRCIVRGVYINSTLSAHTVVIKDGTETKFTIPASATAGQDFHFFDVGFGTSLVVDPDDSSTGSVTVIYKKV